MGDVGWGRGVLVLDRCVCEHQTTQDRSTKADRVSTNMQTARWVRERATSKPCWSAMSHNQIPHLQHHDCYGDSQASAPARGSPRPLSPQKEATFCFVRMWRVKPRRERCHDSPDSLQLGLWSGEVRARDCTALPEHGGANVPQQFLKMPVDAEIFHTEVTHFVLRYTVHTTRRNE